MQQLRAAARAENRAAGLPFRGIEWDMGVCHTWYIVPVGTGNVRFAGSTDGSFVAADIPAPDLDASPSAATGAAAPVLHSSRGLVHRPADLR